MATKTRKFSFTRFIINAVPNFANDDVNDVDLTPTQADTLVTHQLSLPNPLYLAKDSFLVAGITESKSISAKVYKGLLKAGIISEAPSTDKKSSGLEPSQRPAPLNTSAISRKFAHQVPCISVHAQRKLVGMLFFWEEELTRFQLLDAEEADILMAIKAGGCQNQDLEVVLRAVQMRKNLVPSQRGEATANITGGVGYELPSYG
jgi:hypothetical protein